VITIDQLNKKIETGLNKLADGHNNLTDAYIKHEEAINNLILYVKDLAELYEKIVAALETAARNNMQEKERIQ
jgi:archaellum component FlaC